MSDTASSESRAKSFIISRACPPPRPSIRSRSPATRQPAPTAAGTSATRYFDGPRPRLFAHRGASGRLPENTLEAFQAGLADGADRLELDVHATSDGHVVVLHDPTLERTTDGRGAVHELPLAAVRQLDAGARFVAPAGSRPERGRGIRVPTLAALLEACPGVPLNIEIKQEAPAIEEAVLGVLDRYGARSLTLLAAEEATIMTRIRAAAPEMPTSASAAEVADFVGRLQQGRLAGFHPPFVALQVPPEYGGITIVTPELIAAAHAMDVEVHVWTINEPAEMDRLLDLGVDAIMTDVPAVAHAVYCRRGLRSAAAMG